MVERQPKGEQAKAGKDYSDQDDVLSHLSD
jgi:hypothetical protein